ncbi:MAG: PEP-CTERM sorting domain-containing protein [Opitutaceae bacterium]
MNTKKTLSTVSALAFCAALSSHAALTPGTIINVDYGTSNGVATATTGPAGGGGFWNSNNGGFIGSGLNSGIDSNNNGIDVGSFVSGPDATGGGSSGSFGWGTPGDALQQDYIFLSGGTGTTLNGTSVGTFRRLTIFTGNGLSNGIDQGSQWDITFIGGGNADGQGLSVMVNDGGSFLIGSADGANAGTANIGNFDADNTVTFSSIDAVPTAGTGADIEFWIYTAPGGSTSALQGVQLTLVPEPSAYAMLAGFAALGFAMVRRRK